MFAVLAYLLRNAIKNFMDSRVERIKDDLSSARLSKKQAAELKAEYQGMIDNIEKEREEILSEARRLAVRKSDQILSDAKEEAEYLLIKAKDEIKIERENAADDMKMKIIEISTSVASRFIEASVGQRTQDRYIDEALADWSEQV
jgi:F-type H+-transporting ATPase subunit b